MKISPLAALGCLLALAACESPTGSGSDAKSLTSVLTPADGYVYYDLSDGSTVADPATKNWDIALSSSTGGILTNSGATATSKTSSGAGGVYYAGSSDFDSVKSYDSTKFTQVFTTDTNIYETADQGGGPMTSQKVVNQITKLEYDGGDGSSGNPYTYSDIVAAYAGSAYYAYNETTHAISASGEVYIVRQGDGTHYTKFQVVSMTSESDPTTHAVTSRTRVIKYKNF